MRADQLKRLQELSERLADQFILDADPDHWSGAGQKTAEMTQQERGDAYWCRKAAIATGGVLSSTMRLINDVDLGAGQLEGEDDALDKMVKAAERRAKEALQRAMNRTARDAPAAG